MYYLYEDMVSRLTDLKRLSTPPLPGSKSGEQSSTDKRSHYDGQRDAYVDWGANADADGYIREQEDGGKVLAEMEGPGCLWRIWFGNPDARGRLKVFLDGSDQPAVDMDTPGWFGKGKEPFCLENLCYEAAMGFNCYIPIPYSSACKIVGYGDFGAFYQFTYSHLEDGATVDPFSLPLSGDQIAALRRANDTLGSAMSEEPLDGDYEHLHVAREHIPPKGTRTLLALEGEGAICHIRMRPDDATWRRLKELVVSMYWDGETQASVWAPFCDFFGGACGKNDTVSLPAGIREDGWFYCRWYMPFTKGARIAIANLGEEDIQLDAKIYTDKPALPVGGALRFHAKWNRDQFQPERKDRWPDYTLLKVKGAGRFLGCTLHVFKPVDNRDIKGFPGEYWWGEGDEKFFVDGEKSPSFFGTGSEDYFGYAWAWPTLFSKAYHAQNFNQGGIHNRGNRSLVRYHVPDDIPFFSAFEASIEKYYDHHFARYGVTVYWYLQAGVSDPYPPATLEQVVSYYVEDPENTLIPEPTCSIIPNSGFAQGRMEGWAITRNAAFQDAGIRETRWGNCFFYRAEGGDGLVSELASPRFVAGGDTIDFLLGGTWRRDPEGSFAALVRADNNEVLASACCVGEEMRRVVWDIREFNGIACIFKIIDEGKAGARSLAFTDLHVAGELA